MADQAVDIRRVGEVVTGIDPSITNVTGRALLKVWADDDTGVVHHQRQADIDAMLVSLERRGITLPIPVGSVQQILPDLRVAA